MPNVLNEFAGDGVTRTFNFSMTGGYLSRDYVYFFTRPNDDLLNYTPYNDDDVTWITDFSVQTANPIPVGTTFVILRSTTLEPLVDFQNTSRITEKNLDTATWQSIHIAAETSDTVGRIQVVASGAMMQADAATRLATDAAQSASTSQAAAQASQLAAQSAQAAALEAQEDAGAAAASAATAQQQSIEALQVSQQADGKSTLALQLAQHADGNASAADSKANSAVSTAGQANATANAANNTAGQANATANAADAKANTAVQTADQATATADEALGLVEQAVSGAVVSFNGRQGSVIPYDGDYDKFKVGLPRVDNTSDADKPVSGPQQAALDLKADKTYVDTQLSTKADKTYVDAQLGTKTTQAYVDSQVNPIKTDLDKKADKTQVTSDIAASATASLDRANHTGTQPVSTISGLGGAATANLVSSQFDMNQGRVATVGYGGIGLMRDSRNGAELHGNLPPWYFNSRGTSFSLSLGGSDDHTGLNLPGLVSGDYGVLTIHGHWSDSSAAGAIQRHFVNQAGYWFSVSANSTTWNNWQKVITDTNIMSYTSGAATRLSTARSINGSVFDGTVDIEVPAFGRGQSWKKPTRAANVMYYNTTPRAIALELVVLRGDSAVDYEAAVWTNGIRRTVVAGSPSSPRACGHTVIQAGEAYVINLTGGASIYEAYELS